jgi:branched-chain amino acid transport system ATP-binding protein
LRYISLSFAAGDVVTLIDANAADKTTTLRAIVGLKGLTSGTIHFDSVDISQLSTANGCGGD